MCELVSESGITIVNPYGLNRYGEHSDALLEQHDPHDIGVENISLEPLVKKNETNGKVFLTVEALWECLSFEELKVLQGVRTF